jgi:hypothetical protein
MNSEINKEEEEEEKEETSSDSIENVEPIKRMKNKRTGKSEKVKGKGKEKEKEKEKEKGVRGGILYEKNGWIYVSVSGAPRKRGYDYGKLIFKQMKQVKDILDFMVYNDYGIKWEFFVRACTKYYLPKIKEQFAEFYEEMVGFSEGCSKAGTKMSIEEVVAWNNFFTLTEGWLANMPEEEATEIYGPNDGSSGRVVRGSKEGGHSAGQQERCSGFIAVGDWTADKKIVMAHNNFSNFIDGQLAKIVLDLNPTKGCRMLIQGFPGWIWSGTDFFVTSAGIMGTETTIGGFNKYENNIPISCRIRQAMQYGNSLDDYEKILLDGNSGDYANSWLFGDTKTNEIMRIELGLKYHNTERTFNGHFIGFNAPYDPRIRNLECANTGFDDIRRHQGARRVRLADLMAEKKGKIDIKAAQDIIADHYDVYLNKENPCSRTCCSHYELDAREYMSDPSRPKPYQPRGALDGNVCDTTMAKAMSFSLRWGNSCGIPFDKAKFCDEHREWAYLAPYLEDRPQQPWTDFGITNTNSGKKQGTRKQRKHKIE